MENVFLGSFRSKSVKVISKPSKKKVASKSADLCIVSGTPIALFNRVRSQTVTTRYLGVAGPELVSIEGSWDAFLIWSVNDPRFDAQAAPGISPIQSALLGDRGLVDAANDHPQRDLVWTVPSAGGGGGAGWMAPGDHVVKAEPHAPDWMEGAISAFGHVPQAIRYDEPVVLQHVGTGLVTRPLIARKLEGRMNAVVTHLGDEGNGIVKNEDCGGEFLPSSVSNPLRYGHIELQFTSLTPLKIDYDDDDNDDTATPEEGCPARGDPISQLHKVAFQLADAPSQYLSLDEDTIGLHHVRYPHTYPPAFKHARAPTRKHSNTKHHVPPASSTHSTRSKTKYALRKSAKERDDGSYEESSEEEEEFEDEEEDEWVDAGRSRRAGRKSKGKAPAIAPGVGRARGSPPELVEVGETCIWTVVGTDQAEYTFHIPPTPPPTTSPPPRQTPLPIHPFPTVHTLTNFKNAFITLLGENFRKNLRVYFGAAPARSTEFRGTEMIIAGVPASFRDAMEVDDDAGGTEAVPVLLVRETDGVVFRTGQYYVGKEGRRG
ncbi:hypothetical protein BDK51DRAFT_43053 [Blyttiomyces helicus]|uniref:Beta-trefoil DNA-binding domain-containing protein n=1 Tax=Blyttiomyces helicus TaxID=388810 RepID=A0A4P9WEW1_9FUNG|nr:hypothetical protein BDK51DRAFT_43053 [Blyttiomyces helicus]|eukprot:RKO91269.1 hypothetical protein BDK51DRAFT_43053 [Blyttiomyces helicus]